MSVTLTSDWEITTWNKGNPYDSRNFPVCVGAKFCDEPTEVCFEDWDLNTCDKSTIDLFVFFNAKFDLAWWRKCGQDISGWKIWCCQVAEFLLEGQRNPYPSLNDAATKYGFDTKIDIVATEYWDKGINTDQIPVGILSEYCKWDVDLTYKVYCKQLEQFKQRPLLYRTFLVYMEDLKVLQEMEWNGQTYDENLCRERMEKLQTDLSKIHESLSTVYPDVPINFNSSDQLSAFLYGGSIIQIVKQPDGTFKSGQRAGEIRWRNVEVVHELPRLVEPLPRSEMAKPGIFSTAEGTLKKLKGPNARKYVGALLEYARLDKLISTYYAGIPKINREMCWPEGVIHGQYNQCVASTGRLSSTKPNQQNQAGEILDIFQTRY